MLLHAVLLSIRLGAALAILHKAWPPFLNPSPVNHAVQTGRLNKPRSVQADPNAVMACALEIASALHCLHSSGHVHGNVSADWYAWQALNSEFLNPKP